MFPSVTPSGSVIVTVTTFSSPIPTTPVGIGDENVVTVTITLPEQSYRL